MTCEAPAKALDCPFCDGAIASTLTEYGDLACLHCGLAGPEEVLKGLATHIAALEADRDAARKRVVELEAMALEAVRTMEVWVP